MTKREAEERALIHVTLVFEGRNDSVVIVDEATIRKPYGWVFFYQSRKYMESGNLSDMLAGNGPIVVLDSDASIHELGTAYAVEDELRSFEQRMHLAG